jgi:hypothetical protein
MQKTHPESKKYKAIRLAPFLLALVCFFLPFFRISDYQGPLVEVSGFDLFMGKTIEYVVFYTSQSGSYHLSSDAAFPAFMSVLALVTMCIFEEGNEGKISRQFVPIFFGAMSLAMLIILRDNVDRSMGFVYRQYSLATTVDMRYGYVAMFASVVIGILLHVYYISIHVIEYVRRVLRGWILRD